MRLPRTLEEAYELRDASATPEDQDYYQEYVYRLRAQEYFSRDIWTDRLLRRRELRGLFPLRKDNEGELRPWYKRMLGRK